MNFREYIVRQDLILTEREIGKLVQLCLTYNISFVSIVESIKDAKKSFEKFDSATRRLEEIYLKLYGWRRFFMIRYWKWRFKK